MLPLTAVLLPFYSEQRTTIAVFVYFVHFVSLGCSLERYKEARLDLVVHFGELCHYYKGAFYYFKLLKYLFYTELSSLLKIDMYIVIFLIFDNVISVDKN